MKHMTRKLLSLLMVLAMLLTMVPAAFAMSASDFDDWDDWDVWEDYIDEYELDDLANSDLLKNKTIHWDEDECEELEEDHPSKPKNDTDEVLEIIDWENVDDYTDLDYFEWDEDDLEDFFVPPTCGDDNEGIIGVACTECGAWGYIELPDLHDWDDDPVDYDEDEEQHELECLECEETEWFDCDNDCDCGEDEDKDAGDYPDYVDVDVDDGLILELKDDTNDGFYHLNDDPEDEDVWVYIEADVEDDDIDDYTVKFVWSGDGSLDPDADKDDAESELLVDTSEETAAVTCKVTATKGDTKLEATVTWELEVEADIVVEVVAYNDTELVFGDADEEGNDSVLDQIIAGVEDLDDEYYFEYITFEDSEFDGGELDIKTSYKYFDEDADDYDEDEKKHALLSEVEFTPEEDYEGTVRIDVTVYYYNDKDKLKNTTGTIEIEVKKGGTGLGIVLSAKSGDEIEIDEDLFLDFWDEAYEDGELEKVKFNSISKGTLYYDGDDEAKLSGKTCYVEPTSKQMGLDALTYVPAKNTTTATIEFTASGKNEAGKAKTASGEITILFTEGTVEPIVYDYTGSNIKLEADDFTELYKEVMDVSRASNLQIQFLETPDNGTLYVNYSAKTGRGTALTDRTVGTFKFSSSTSAARSIEDVTYVPGAKAAGDTVPFACYAGSALKFLGTVEFGKSDPVKLTKISSTNGVTFAVADFFSGDLATASYITFGTPTSGTLYMNYNGSTGTKVTSGMKFSAFSATSLGYYNVNTVTFVPAKSGTATVPFTGATYNGKTIEGTMEITTVVNRFPDLKSDHWAFNHIMKLVGMGVVGGDDKGNVNPEGQITYGEVLKIVMKAAGYADQKATGTHWASGYLTKAVADGLISANTDLNAKADRNAVATLTGKALKLTQASSVNAGIAAPIDSNNGYVYALYNAGILTGSNVNGVNYFKGGDTITRAEAFTIVSRVYDYAK